MGKVYKLTESDFQSTEVEWLGIVARHEPYQVAFMINRALKMHLARAKKDIFLKEIGLPAFEFYDEVEDVYWQLIPNRAIQTVTSPSSGLFETIEETRSFYIIKELKKIDYLLKLEGEQAADLSLKVLQYLKTINDIQQIQRVPDSLLTSNKFFH